MAGYSGTPLPKKLGIKEGARLGLSRAPAGFAATLGELPDGVTAGAVGRGKGKLDVIIAFARTLEELAADLAAFQARLDPAGGLWVAWPKRASGIQTDVTETEVRRRGLATGLVDNKVCAIDDTWSGLRFVVPVVKRPRPWPPKPSKR